MAATTAARELRLLWSTLSGESLAYDGDDGTHSCDDILRAIGMGRLASALQLALTLSIDGVESGRVDRTSRHVEQRFDEWHHQTLRSLMEATASGDSEKPLYFLCTAASALLIFAQANLTGLDPELPSSPFALAFDDSAAEPAPKTAAGDAKLGLDGTSQEDRWAAQQLAVDGEHVQGRPHYPQYLLLAVRTLAVPLNMRSCQLDAPILESGTAWDATAHGAMLIRQLPTWLWWTSRALFLQQRALSGRCASLRADLLVLMHVLGDTFGTGSPQDLQSALKPLTPLRGSPGEPSSSGTMLQSWLPSAGVAEVARAACGKAGLGPGDGAGLAASVHMEAALVEQHYGYAEAAEKQFDCAGRALQLKVLLCIFPWLQHPLGGDTAIHERTVVVEGAFGRRTAHQQEAKAQLIATVVPQASQAAVLAVPEADGRVALAFEAGDPAEEVQLSLERLQEGFQGWKDESEVFLAPEVLDHNGNSLGGQQHPVAVQALLLGHCLQVRTESSEDELRTWRMAPFVELLAQQQRSRFLIQAATCLLRVRHEKTRSRTRERALLLHQQLLESLQSARIPSALRIRHAFTVWFPLQAALQKEMGQVYIAYGMVEAAMKVFEAAQLWDSLIVCYTLLGKRALAEELVRNRLEAAPDDPNLLCALGDLHRDDRHYETAWERSGRRHARSQRLLARSALSRKEYSKAAGHYRLALELSTLHPEAWFSLGYCLLKLGEAEEAVQAFTRCVQLEPDNAECWNNIAALHLQQERYRQAFSALSEATKLKKDSWQTWDNLALAAAKSGNFLPACRAVLQTLQLTKGERLNAEVLEDLVAEVQRLSAGGDPFSPPQAALSQPGENDRDAADVEDDAAAAAADVLGALELEDSGGGIGSSSESTSEAPEAMRSGAGDGPTDAVEAAAERMRRQVVQAVEKVLRVLSGTANSDSQFWSLFSHYNLAQGDVLAAQECQLKRVRALQGQPWRTELAAFETYAGSCLKLVEIQREAASASGAASDAAAAGKPSRELGAARMMLRGVVAGAEEHFRDHELVLQLRQQLEQVEALIEQRRAAAAAMPV